MAGSGGTLAHPLLPTLYLARLRLAATGLVVAHHTAITYGGSGGWYYREVPTSGSAGSIVLTLFCSINQAFFMGLFFLIAGYLTPAALARKGARQFLIDRLWRLGLPLLVFGLVIGPMTIALAGTGRGLAMPANWQTLVAAHHYEPGPLWFCQALLLFALGAVLWQALSAKAQTPASSTQVPAAYRASDACATNSATATSATFAAPAKSPMGADLPQPWTWWVSALAVGTAAFAIRLFWPVGTSSVGMQWGYFASYAFLFALGVRAWPGRWLERLPAEQVRRWRWVMRLALPVLPTTGLAMGALRGEVIHFEGGWTLPAAVYAFWEPLVAWGLIAALLQRFRLRHNQPHVRWDALCPQAFAAFVVHAPVLVAISLALQGWVAPPLIKFAVVAPAAFGLSLVVGAALRRVPGVARVL